MGFLDNAIRNLSSTPQQVDDLVQGLSDEQLSWKPGPEVFSMRENILHLRDIDVEGYEQRLELILSETCPSLSDIDGGKLARDRNYNAQPVEVALNDLRRSRAATIDRLKACSDGDLDRQAQLQGLGTIDLRRVLELWLEHDHGHVADMKELRRSLETGEEPSFAKYQAA